MIFQSQKCYRYTRGRHNGYLRLKGNLIQQRHCGFFCNSWAYLAAFPMMSDKLVGSTSSSSTSGGISKTSITGIGGGDVSGTGLMTSMTLIISATADGVGPTNDETADGLATAASEAGASGSLNMQPCPHAPRYGVGAAHANWAPTNIPEMAKVRVRRNVGTMMVIGMEKEGKSTVQGMQTERGCITAEGCCFHRNPYMKPSFTTVRHSGVRP